ncbi:MAG: CHAT domain-containing protein [Marmoricola sp.]
MNEHDARLSAAVEEAEDVALRDPEVALAFLDGLDLHALRSREPRLAARIGYLRARLLALRGWYDDALGAIRAARRDWLAGGSVLDALATDLGRATVLVDVGEHQQSVTVSQTLLTRLTAAGVPPEREEDAMSVRARAHHNLGNAWSGLGDHDEALRHYDLAANLYSAIGWRRLRAETDANRGVTYLRLGMAHRALAELGASVRALRAEGHEIMALHTEIDLADAHLALDDAPTALWLLSAVRSRLEDLGAVPDLGRLAVVVARALCDLGRPDQAHAEALAAYERFTELTMVSEAARAMAVAAWASHLEGRLERGIQEIGVALSLFAGTSNRPAEAAAQIVRGRLEAAAGRRKEAAEVLVEHAALLERMRDNVTACEAHLLLAELAEDVTEARAHLDRAVELVQSLDVPALRARLDLGRARVDRRRGDLTAAAGRLRATLLRQRRGVRRPRGPAEMLPSRGGARDEALGELLDVLLRSGTRDGTVAAWRWASWSNAHLVEELSGRQPVARGWQDPEELPLLEGPVLQYHAVGADLVAFVVRDAQVHARRLPGALAESRRQVDAWRRACALRRLAGGDGGRGTAGRTGRLALTTLQSLLLDPVADLLEDVPGTPLLVVAPGHLASVPFEALACDGDEPLGLRYPLTFAPALTPDPTIAPPSISGARESTLVLAVPDQQAPAVLHDAMVISALRPEAEVHVGARATAAVLRERSRGRDLIHLACHATFDATDPAASTLALGDGPLDGGALRSLDLHDSVLFLAACEGGRLGDDAGAPAGLAWSALAAGARAVLAATWSVDDAATSRFVGCFYRHVAVGRSLQDAVARARVEVAGDDPDPFHWAAFRLTCTPRTALGDTFAH